MQSFQYTITDPVGIHGRPAGLLVKTVKGLSSSVTVTAPDGRSASGARLMALMALGIRCGDAVTVTLEGDDARADAALLEQFFRDHL